MQDVFLHADLQALQGIRDGDDLREHLLLEHVHPVMLDLEKERLLAPDVVVEAGLGEAGGVGDVLDRGGVVALLADEARRRLEDAIPRAQRVGLAVGLGGAGHGTLLGERGSIRERGAAVKGPARVECSR